MRPFDFPVNAAKWKKFVSACLRESRKASRSDFEAWDECAAMVSVGMPT